MIVKGYKVIDFLDWEPGEILQVTRPGRCRPGVCRYIGETGRCLGSIGGWCVHLLVQDGMVESVWEDDSQMGYYKKYIILKSDGSEIDPKADYFVLRLDEDEHARQAIMHYAALIAHLNPALSKDIFDRMKQYYTATTDDKVEG